MISYGVFWDKRFLPFLSVIPFCFLCLCFWEALGSGSQRILFWRLFYGHAQKFWGFLYFVFAAKDGYGIGYPGLGYWNGKSEVYSILQRWMLNYHVCSSVCYLDDADAAGKWEGLE